MRRIVATVIGTIHGQIDWRDKVKPKRFIRYLIEDVRVFQEYETPITKLTNRAKALRWKARHPESRVTRLG